MHGAMQNNNAAGHYVEVEGLVKLFGNDRAVDDVSFGVPKGKFLTLLGPSGCGKTTTLMSIAGLHTIDAGQIRVGGVVYTCAGRRPVSGAGEARHRHGVPELRDLAAHDGRAERRLSARNQESRARRNRGPRRRRAQARRPGPDGRQARYPIVWRTAAADGAGARDRVAAAPAAVRRAAVQSRSQAARADARRTQAHPARGRHHLDLRHPRPVRGAGDERRDHRHEQGPHPADGRPARNLRAPGQRLCQQFHRRRQSAEGPRARGHRARPRRGRDRRRRPHRQTGLPARRRHGGGRRDGDFGAAGKRRGHAPERRRTQASKAKSSRPSSSAIASTAACAGASSNGRSWRIRARA